MSLITNTVKMITAAAGKNVWRADSGQLWNNIGHDVVAFSYQDDFQLLWDIVGKTTSGLAHTVVVVWDGIPRRDFGVVNTSSYLTPIDWAVAFFLSISNNVNAPKALLPRIIIFDMASHEVPDAEALRLSTMLPNIMPWICRYQPHEANEFIHAVLSGPKNFGQGDLELIRRLWSINLTQTRTPDDHHALANLLGPQLLLSKTVRSEEPVIRALRVLMTAVGLLPKNSSYTTDTSWISLGSIFKERKYLKACGLQLVLLDDQWQDGWGEVLCQATGVEFSTNGSSKGTPKQIGSAEHVSIWAAAKPEWLLWKLEDSCIDQRYSFRLIGDNNDNNKLHKEPAEILFIDLRLFSGQSVIEEAKFFQRLVAIAQEIAKRETTLPWPNFTENELDEIDAWAKLAFEKKDDSARTDPRYYMGLTLLPRILAQIDLSLPIVLFTSTGRREIVKEFTEYGNIIGNFEKARLSGQITPDFFEQTRDQFRKAFSRALEIAEGQKICTFLNAAERLGGPIQCLKGTSSVENPWTIEVYIDETGTEVNKFGLPVAGKNIEVGGLLAIFAPGASPNKFNSDLFKLSVNYQDKDKLRADAEILLGEILSLKLQDSPCHLAKVSFTGSIEKDIKDQRSGDLENFQVADNLYRVLSKNVIEIGVFHHARRLCPQGASVSCHIYMATRIIPNVDRNYIQRLSEHFGIRPIDIEDKDNPGNTIEVLRYINYDSVRPLVHEVCRPYKHNTQFYPQIDHARAYVLGMVRQPNNPEGPRALHLLADAVLNPKATGKNIEAVKKVGFHGNLSPSLQIMIHGARLAVCDQLTEALAKSSEIATDLYTSGTLTGASDILIRSLHEAASTLSGQEFLYFLARRKEKKTLKKPSITGVVEKEYWPNYTNTYIISNNGTKYKVTGKAGIPFLGVGDHVEFCDRYDFIPNDKKVDTIIKVLSHPKWDNLIVGKQFDGKILFFDTGKRRCIIDLGGITGILRDDTLRISDSVRVQVTSFNKSKREIFLKRIDQDCVEIELSLDDMADRVYAGKITGIKEFGAFVKLDNNMAGLIHKSNIADQYIDGIYDICNYCRRNEQVKVVVLSAKNGEKRLELGLCKNLARPEVSGKYVDRD